MTDSSTAEVRDKGPLLLLSQRFAAWLAAADVCLALTTYQAGRLFFIGRKDDGGDARARAHHRAVPGAVDRRADAVDQRRARCCGGSRTCSRSVRRRRKARQRKFVPREGRVTGGIDIHDIGMGEIDGTRAPIFVNTLFSCLATVSETASFRPLWRPPFISRAGCRGPLPPQRPRHGRRASRLSSRRSAAPTSPTAGATGAMTAASSSTWRAARSWRAGLSMPHSPRLYDGRLWLLNSGTGEFGTVDPASGRSSRSRSARAMRAGSPSSAGHAVIGLSRPRHNRPSTVWRSTSGSPPRTRTPAADCSVVDLDTGNAVEWLRFDAHGRGALRRRRPVRRACRRRRSASAPTTSSARSFRADARPRGEEPVALHD